MCLLLVGDDDFTSPIFGELCLGFLQDLFKVFHLLKPVAVRLVVNEIDALEQPRVRGARGGCKAIDFLNF